MSDMDHYSNYFPVGKKVGVGIPLPNADVFRDWAIIQNIDEDLVTLQLSRDILPVDVSLHFGQILELRGGAEGSGYSCRAIVVSEGDANEFLLRLIGEIVSDELREFYRIDAFLPIKYFVSREQNVDKLSKQWKERRTKRQLLEISRNDHPWNSALVPTNTHKKVQDLTSVNDETILEPENAEDVEDAWDSIIPLAANISGGGLRIITHQNFEYGEYALLEVLVPTPQRIVDIVGRVVFINRNYAAGKDREYFNTGVQFVYIDESDRDAIVSYISTIQLKRIRQLRERYLYRGLIDNDEQSALMGTRKTAVRAVSLLVLTILIALLASYLWQYTNKRPEGEIERTFEEGVIKYRNKLNPNQ